MSPLTYIYAEEDGNASVTVVFPGNVEPKIALNDHPNFEKILEGARNKDESIKDLFDIAEAASKYFDSLSERVAVKNGRIYFDGDEVENALTKQVLRFLDEGVDDWMPLVNFFEKVQTNTNEHSREQLYGFIERNEISITPKGDVVFYKGVKKSVDEDGETVYTAMNSGHGIVDGEELFDSYLPQYIGSTVEIPRNEVKHDPNAPCHIGLHAATFSFAKGFAGGGTVLEVHVNPRDVVSVPHSAEKIRCCRYVVIGEAEQSYDTALVGEPTAYTPIFDEDEDRCDCGAYWESCDQCDDELADEFMEGSCSPFTVWGTSSPDVSEVAKTEINATRRIPTPEEFQALREKARRQRKGIPAIAKEWEYLGGDKQDRNNYVAK